ncbi:MAG: type I restriction-modification system subunit M [Dehalococcoides mccartyi]|uniref:type I restriction-modification system subunit M n=1 Tax=Dehalococcoides mccartyi TaxID=61435 RepID=UPI0025C7E50E|nr:type I restriction-modification system subunit M [Dehalococcoides mccartyi]MDN4186774.1 type I restriction-modification system subunit M [Dehalococcoides mccartyi]
MSTSKKDIENALMRGADSLRDTIDAANYKDYVLPLMFIKYLSDTYAEKVEDLEKEYEGVRLERQKRYLPFTVAQDCSFTSLYEQRYSDKIGELINMAMRQIENDNNQQLAGVLNTTDYNSENALGTREHKNAILRELLEDLYPLDLRPSQIEIKEGQVPADVIGDAYEYMIGQFASMAGKKAGSFYTPAAVSEVMARIVAVKPGDRLYDPTCGSGSLLIKSAKQARSKQISIYGQEVNGSSVAMAKMNMYIHEISDAKIAWGDTLANPMFKDDDGNLLTFDAIVANMPFSKDKWAAGFNPGGESSGKGKKEFKMEATLDKYHRFDWGVPPASKGDWAFLLHMIASLAVGGRIAAVAPHGVLFRGAAEGRIRQRVVDENLLDAVIGLPENLFYGTSIPACILVFKKGRQNTDVCFIDASKKDENGNLRYVKASNQNELGTKNIEDIITAYQNRVNVDKFVHVATRDEIIQNDYNLNIPRYVDTFEEEELVDIDEVQQNIARLKVEIAEAEKQMDAYLKELGL